MDDRPPLPVPGPCLETWRPDVLGRVAAVWALAVLLISVGLVGTGLSMFGAHLLSPAGQWAAGLVGWPCAVAGPLVGLIGILRVVSRDDGVLQVCRHGLVSGLGDEARFLPWRAIARIEAGPAGLTLHPESGPPLVLARRWLGMATPALAARLGEWRRRLLLGVLRPPPR